MRTRSDAQLLAHIRTLHASSRGTYGAPRIHAQLAREGIHVGRKRVARLMRMAGLCGASRRRWPRTTRPRAGARRAPDLVRRHFSAEATNVLWVADATYVPTGEGFLYLAVVLDVFSRRVVGWAMSSHLYTELMLRALDMALQQRRHDGVILHSDQGCQGGFNRSLQHLLDQRCCNDRLNPPNTPPLPSGGAAEKPAYNRRWGPPATLMTTRCASHSSARSKPNCSVANTSRPTNRQGGVCSRFWRAGTTYAASTAASATVRRSNSKTCMRKIKAYRRAGCPPPGSVVVLTGDPPPGRGQPAI
ncbi:transposase InsO family protein [Paraburkholderia sp. MM5496-R1]